MSFRGDPLFEMLDTATADRMLDGTVLPGDAPPGYEQVALLLTALSVPRPPAGAAAAAPRTVELPRISPRRRRPALVATVVTAAILSSTAGAAFANVLPDAIGRPLHHLMQHIGHPSSPAERHSTTVTTPPAGRQARESSLRQTPAQRLQDRRQAGSTPGGSTVPPSDSNAGSKPSGPSPTLPDQSQNQSALRPTPTVPAPQNRPTQDQSILRSASRSLTHPAPAPDAFPRPIR
jgi:hypothetical protein